MLSLASGFVAGGFEVVQLLGIPNEAAAGSGFEVAIPIAKQIVDLYYSLTNWGGDSFSAIIHAMDARDPGGIDTILKSNRDDINAAGGIRQMSPSWDIAGVPAEKRLLEIALLTTSGTMFYLHNGKHTLQPQIDVIPKWTPAEQAMLQTQNNHAPLAPAGLRVKLPTQDDHSGCG